MGKVFRAAEMMSEDVQSYVISCQYQVASADAPIEDGSFVKLGELKPDTTYAAAGDKDYNVYLASMPTAVTDKVVVIADLLLVTDSGSAKTTLLLLWTPMAMLSLPLTMFV